MKAMFMILFAAIGVAVAMAQTNPSQYHPSGGTAPSTYQPAVPVAPQVYGGGSTYGGWGYGGGGAAGGGALTGAAMQGMASVVNAKGNYNLSTSAAAMNMTQAQKQEIQNWSSFTNTYFDLHHQPQGSGRRTGEEPNRRTAQPHRPGRCAQTGHRETSGPGVGQNCVARRTPTRPVPGARGNGGSGFRRAHQIWHHAVARSAKCSGCHQRHAR